MKTLPHTFSFACDTATLIAAYKRYANRHFVTPALERVLHAIETEIERRKEHALATI